MKTRLLTIGAALALTVGLAGCGSSTSGSAASGGSIASGMIFGGPAEFKTRTDGLPGIQKTYGVKFGQFKVTDTGAAVTVRALKQGQVDAVDLFTTDPSIKANGFVVLTDDKHNFSAQNIVPIITKSKATAGVKSVINGVQAKLTTDGLRTLVGDVQNKKQDPGAVAKSFLSSNGLGTTGSKASGVTLTVGSANFPENVVLADIYAQALQAQGATIRTKLNIGSREKYYPALKSGAIDLFPEYSGTILVYLDKNTTASSPADVYTALGKALPSNLIELDMADAQDSDAVVVTAATAKKYDLKTIGDLAKSAS